MIAPVSIGLIICFQKIGEKEDFQNNKHDKKFYNDYQPCLFTP